MLLFETIIIILCLVILLVASFCDIKTTEVPDWLSYGAIFTGIGVRLLWSTATFDWTFIIAGALGLVAFAVLSYSMYYLGQWGGGDSKLFMGLGALIGFELRPDALLVSFFVALIVVGAVYGIVWSAVLAVKNWRAFVKTVKKLLSKKIFVVGHVCALAFFVVFAASALFVPDGFRIVSFALALLMLVMFYSMVFIRATELCCMYKLVSPKALTEGDWIVKDVMVAGKRICGPKDLGVSKKSIRELVKLEQKGKIKNVLIKVGIPFVPSFLVAFVVAVLFGNLLLYLI